MFSNLSSSSISLATVTPSLVTTGAPKDFSITTLRPLGPRVTVTASARRLTPLRVLSLASWLNFTILAAILVPPYCVRLRLLKDTENVVFAHNQVLFAVDFDFGTRILAKQHPVARLHVQRGDLAILVHLAFTNGNHLPLLGFFLRRVRNNKPAFGLFLL